MLELMFQIKHSILASTGTTQFDWLWINLVFTVVFSYCVMAWAYYQHLFVKEKETI